MSAVLRTPDERFAGLPGYDFAPHWHEWQGMRLHYVDEGFGRPVVLFHGEPTWSFLYRKVMGPLLDGGYRVIAPDYPGFGKSDKPTDPGFYTYDRHVEAMASLLGSLGLEGAGAVVHDWGGPIGLRLAVERSGWFERLTILNTGLFRGTSRMSETWMAFRAMVERAPDLDVGRLMRASAVTAWDDGVVAAYDAPFPSPEHKAGARRFPLLVPLSPADPGADAMSAVREALSGWSFPTQVLFSTADPIFSPGVGRRFVELIPGATALETVDEAGHFLQEDQGERVGAAVAEFLSAHE